jgi:hypothetical protein
LAYVQGKVVQGHEEIIVGGEGKRWHIKKEGGRGKVINDWERIWGGTATVKNTVARATGSPGSEFLSQISDDRNGSGFEIDVSQVKA